MVTMTLRAHGLALAIAIMVALTDALAPPDPSSSFLDVSSSSSRRDFFRTAGTFAALSVATVPPSHARGLVSFPCERPMLNVYHLMRVGTTLLEEEGIWSTNPLFLTNREAALSDRGLEEVYDACQQMKAIDLNPSVVKYSLAASAMDTASIVKNELQVGQNRLVPEFTFMDPRGVGRWEMLDLKTTQDAVIALDATEAGSDGKGGRPPANEDGTAHETLADQSVRLRQLMSVLETQYSGDNILLIFPDATSPALLSAMMAGIPYDRAHEFAFRPGEVRFDVNMKSALQWIDSRTPEEVEAYQASLARGKEELVRLRSLDPETIINIRDQQIEEDRIAAEVVQEKLEEKRRMAEDKERSEREARAQELESTRMTSSETDGNVIIGPLAVAVSAAVTGIATVGSGRKNEIEDNSANPEANASRTTDLDSTTMVSESDNALRELEETFSADAIREIVPDTTSSGSSSSLYGNPIPTTPEDRAQAAKDAMDDYMNSDDGGEAWLQMMAEIARDNDKESRELIAGGFVNGNNKNITSGSLSSSSTSDWDKFV